MYNTINKYKDFDDNNSVIHTCYFAHSMQYYNTNIEKKIIEKLSKKYHVLNPNELNLGHNMMSYIDVVYNSDIVVYHGNTVGVAFEVLSAMAFNKPVMNVDLKYIPKKDLNQFRFVFKNSKYAYKNMLEFKYAYPDYANIFNEIIEGA